MRFFAGFGLVCMTNVIVFCKKKNEFSLGML
jgi:hypothetical protein